MKKLSFLVAVLLGCHVSSFAQAVGPVPGCPAAFGPTKIVEGTSKNDTTSVIRNNNAKVFWVKDTIYIVKGIVRVAPYTTLEIAQGTIVMGFPLTGVSGPSAIHIKQNARINVLGDVNNPVVMTSCKIQGARNRGDWGGLVICGNAPSNQGVNAELEGGYGAYYGGTNAEDNSGSIQFLRVEFAGVAMEPDKEMNGITLAGVGARSTFRNVQVSYSGDDSFEWFGGTVNGRFLISNRPLDDDFDTDNGYSGILQFGVALREYNAADFSGSNGFESDNESNGDVAGAVVKLPKTSAIFSNFSLYGPLIRKGQPYNRFFKTGAILRRNTEQDIYNSVFAGWPGDTTVNDGVQSGRETGGVYIFGTNAADNLISGRLRFKKNTVLQFSNYKQSFATDNLPTFNASAFLMDPAFGNVYNNNVTFYTPFTVNDPIPSFRLPAGSPLLNGSSFPAGGASPLNSDLTLGTNMFSTNPAARGFTNVAYRGGNDASSEWAEPWAEYNPNLFRYVAGVVPTRQGAISHFFSGNGVESVNAIAISPNPAVLNTTVKFLLDVAAADAALTVLDMNGNVVASEKALGGVNEIPLNTAGFEPGTYIVKVSANGTVTKTAKLSVVR